MCSTQNIQEECPNWDQHNTTDDQTDSIEKRISRLSHFTSTLTKQLIKVNQMNLDTGTAQQAATHITEGHLQASKEPRASSKSAKKVKTKRKSASKSKKRVYIDLEAS